jgi:hypothetical protein
MNLKEIDVNVRSWFDSSRDRGPWKYFVNEALNIRVPWTVEYVNLSFSYLILASVITLLTRNEIGTFNFFSAEAKKTVVFPYIELVDLPI